MSDEKQVRKVARCVKVLLEIKGFNITSKQIMDRIQDQDLSNPEALRDQIENDMRINPLAEKHSDRRQKLENFMQSNWSLISGNNVVKSVLLNAYCMGRYTKEQRQKMVDDLLDRCNPGDQDPDSTYDF